MSTDPASDESSREEPAPQTPAQVASSGESAQQSSTQSDARYASQAAAAEPAPVAFEGGAAAPGRSGGTTGRSEWLFLVLAVFFSLALVTIPAIFFSSIDLLATGDETEAPTASENSREAREDERLQLLQETRADALSKLHSYGPSEQDSTAFRIPVDRAMRLTLSGDSAASIAGAAGSVSQ